MTNQRPIAVVPDQEGNDFVEIADDALPQPADQCGQRQRDEQGWLGPAEERGNDAAWHDQHEVDHRGNGVMLRDIQYFTMARLQHKSVVITKKPDCGNQQQATCYNEWEPCQAEAERQPADTTVQQPEDQASVAI